MGDVFSPNETSNVKPGQVLVDAGANVWVTWANGSSLLGHNIGICLSNAAPGNPIQVCTEGRIPYAQYNLGPGGPSTILASANPGRGGQSGGQVIGTCDPSGTIFMWPSYVGTPSQVGTSTLGILGGVALNTVPPTTGQAPVFDGTRFTFASAGSSSTTWASDLAGSTNSNQWVAAISGNGGAGGAVTLASNAFLNQALAGTLLKANSVALLSTDGSGDVALNAPTGAYVAVQNNSTNIARLGAASTDYIVLGDTVANAANAGLIRTSNSQTIIAGNKSGTFPILMVDSSGNVQLTSSPSGTPGASLTLNIADPSNPDARIKVNGTTAWQVAFASTDFYAAGASPPSAGLLRLGNSTNTVLLEISQVSGGVASPLIQTDGSLNVVFGVTTSNAGTGSSVGLFAQPATGGGHFGGNIAIQSGAGSSGASNGNIQFSPSGAGNGDILMLGTAVGTVQWANGTTPVFSQVNTSGGSAPATWSWTTAAGSTPASAGAGSNGGPLSVTLGAGGTGNGATSSGGTGGSYSLTTGAGGSAGSGSGARGQGGNITFTLGAKGATGTATSAATNSIFSVVSNDAGPQTMLQIAANNNDVLYLGNFAGSDYIQLGHSGIGFGLSTSSPQITHVTAANGSTPTSMTISPQAPNASSTGSAGTPGSLLAALAAPVSTGAEAKFQVTRGGNAMWSMTYGGASQPAIYVGTVSTTGTNYTLTADASNNNVVLNAAANVFLEIAGSNIFNVSGSRVGFTAPIGGTTSTVPLSFAQTTGIAVGSGSFSLTAGQYSTTALYFTGTLGSGTTTVTFPASTPNGVWVIDTNGVTFGANTLTLSAGGARTISLTTSSHKKLLIAVDGSSNLDAIQGP